MDDENQTSVYTVFQISPELVSDSLSPEGVRGWDSLGHMRLVMALQEESGVEFEVDDIMRMENVGEIREHSVWSATEMNFVDYMSRTGRLSGRGITNSERKPLLFGLTECRRRHRGKPARLRSEQRGRRSAVAENRFFGLHAILARCAPAALRFPSIPAQQLMTELHCLVLRDPSGNVSRKDQP